MSLEQPREARKKGRLRRGVYLPPAPFETAFVSAAHARADIDRTVDAAADALREARSGA